jgi:hypothetical protein
MVLLSKFGQEHGKIWPFENLRFTPKRHNQHGGGYFCMQNRKLQMPISQNSYLQQSNCKGYLTQIWPLLLKIIIFFKVTGPM